MAMRNIELAMRKIHRNQNAKDYIRKSRGEY